MVDTTTTAGVIVHRCYVCGGPIVGPTSYHTDKGAVHGSCLFPPDPAAELAALGQRIEELEAREVEHGFRLEAEEAKSEHWRAESSRLREALERIADMDEVENMLDPSWSSREARAALGRKA